MKKRSALIIAIALVATLAFASVAMADVNIFIDGVTYAISDGGGTTTMPPTPLSDGWSLNATGSGAYTLNLNGSYAKGRIEVYSNVTTETLIIEISGNVDINVSDNTRAALQASRFQIVNIVPASPSASLTLKNDSYDGLGIYGGGKLTIGSNLTLTATGTDNTQDCAGIWCNGDIEIQPGANVTASTTGGSGAGEVVAGIHAGGYIEAEGCVINASGSSNAADGAGIYSVNSYVEILGSDVTATGSSQNGSSAGILTGNSAPNVLAIDIADYSGAPSNVTAEGKGPHGYGMSTNGKVRIDSASDVKATAHGDGYSIDASKIDGGSAKVSLIADDDAHYCPATTDVSTMDPNVKKSTPGSGSSGGGGCDSGFGVIGAAALGALLTWRKRK